MRLFRLIHTRISFLLLTGLGLVLSLYLLALPTVACANEAKSSPLDLVGLWMAKRNFGPEIRGTLTIGRDGDRWHGEIAGHRVEGQRDGSDLTFALPGSRGTFRGRLGPDGSIVGHWMQPPTRRGGQAVASPVRLTSNGKHRWQGEVVPFDDDFTFFLLVEEREDGVAGAFLRNPQRNFGVFLNVDRIERDGDQVQLIGSWRRNTDERVFAHSTYEADLDSLSFMLRYRTFDFHRVGDDAASPFYARGREPRPFSYRPPQAEGDGWPVGTLGDAGMVFEPLRRLVETEIDPPAQSVHAPYVHGMLIARHGKLVFEEYFHGFHRDLPHDTRSASKSAASVLVGAAIAAGEPISLSTPVYETIYGDAMPEGLDPRARRITVEHLLTMSSGLDCDDSDYDSPGNEERVQSQRENLDWYDYTLGLGMVRDPGAAAVYCSVNPNLLGKVLETATGESLASLFHRLIAEPLEVSRYHLNLQPTGEPYLGGGFQWLPRDFMKLGQVILDGGTWKDRRILDEPFARRSTAPQVEIQKRGYGYLWWVVEYPFGDGTVEAFYAGGNGGQLVMGIPELDLLVAFFAGNYSDSYSSRIQQELVPEYILKAIASEGRTADRE